MSVEIIPLLLAVVPAFWLVWCQRARWRFSLRSLLLLTATLSALFSIVAWQGSLGRFTEWILSGRASSPVLRVALLLWGVFAGSFTFWIAGSVFLARPSRTVTAHKRIRDRRRYWQTCARTPPRHFLWVPDSFWPAVFYIVFYPLWMMFYPVLPAVAPTYYLEDWGLADPALCPMLYSVNAGFIVLLLVDLAGQLWREGWRLGRRAVPYLVALWLLGMFEMHVHLLAEHLCRTSPP